MNNILVIHTDNRKDRGQALRTPRPAYDVELSTLYSPDVIAGFYRQDGIHELLGMEHRDFLLDENGDPRALAQLIQSSDSILFDHESLHPAFSAVLNHSQVAECIRERVRGGALLWIGFQSSGFVPAWFESLGRSPWRVSGVGQADALEIERDHALVEGFPVGSRLNWITNDSYRALKAVACTEPFIHDPLPSERGSIAWLSVDRKEWTVLGHKADDDRMVALAITPVGNGNVVLDQTLALYGANIDSRPSRVFAANIRRFLGDSKTVDTPNGMGQGFYELRSDTSPNHARRKVIHHQGVPFAVYGDENILAIEGSKAVLPCGMRAKKLFFLGGTLSWPFGTGSWFVKASDFSQDYFVGDNAGDIHIYYEDGSVDSIPLILGWTLFWPQSLIRNESQQYLAPFNDPAALAILHNTLILADGPGITGALSWMMCIEPRPQRIRDIVVRKRNDKIGFPVYGAITVLTDTADDRLLRLADRSGTDPDWRRIQLPVRYDPERTLPLQRLLYTFPEDVQNAPRTVATGFQGAALEFRGNPSAELLTVLYSHNMSNLERRLHPEYGGPCLNSNTLYGWYRGSVGTWLEKKWEVLADYWSRDNGRAGVERLALGLHRGVDKEIRFFDSHLYCGRPPHMERYLYDCSIRKQWTKVSRTGNTVTVPPENDGHGLAMLYRSHYLRHHPEKLDELWKATVDYAEWIVFSMENPLDPGQPPDTLYTVSECSGYQDWDIHSNYLCYAGLMTCIGQARQKGDQETCRRWTLYERRLRTALLKYLRDETGGWRASPHTQWRSMSESLAPLVGLPDWNTYDVRQSDPEMFAVSLRTYETLITQDKWWNRMRMIGYDHTFVLQAALLLDDPRFERLLNTLVHTCYSAHGPDPWIVAEGSIVKEDESRWYRGGMGGNLVHLAEVLKVVRLMVGVDDLTAGQLRIMPRVPEAWSGISVKEYPIGCLCGGKPAGISYVFSHDRMNARFDYSTRGQVNLSVRLGPFGEECTNFSATVNGTTAAMEVQKIYNAYWVWIRDIAESKGSVAVVGGAPKK